MKNKGLSILWFSSMLSIMAKPTFAEEWAFMYPTFDLSYGWTWASDVGEGLEKKVSLYGAELDAVVPLFEEEEQACFVQAALQYAKPQYTRLAMGVGYRALVAPELSLGFILMPELIWYKPSGEEYSTPCLSGVNLKAESKWKTFCLHLGSTFPLERLQAKKKADEIYGAAKAVPVSTKLQSAQGIEALAQWGLPFYPAFSLSFQCEWLFGSSVWLVNQNALFVNPKFVHLGCSWEPISAFALDYRHVRGINGLKEHKLGIRLRYEVGIPVAKQFKPMQRACYLPDAKLLQPFSSRASKGILIEKSGDTCRKEDLNRQFVEGIEAAEAKLKTICQ